MQDTAHLAFTKWNETQKRKKKKGRGKKKADFAKGYTATEPEVQLRKPDLLPYMILTTSTGGN